MGTPSGVLSASCRGRRAIFTSVDKSVLFRSRAEPLSHRNTAVYRARWPLSHFPFLGRHCDAIYPQSPSFTSGFSDARGSHSTGECEGGVSCLRAVELPLDGEPLAAVGQQVPIARVRGLSVVGHTMADMIGSRYYIVFDARFASDPSVAMQPDPLEALGPSRKAVRGLCRLCRVRREIYLVCERAGTKIGREEKARKK